VLANYHQAGEKEVQMAIDAALKAHRELVLGWKSSMASAGLSG
jgi:hypothetical protein